MSTAPPPVLIEQSTLTIGQKLGHSSQFTIVRVLGRGGFGEVYLAREDRADRYVAIKVMLPKLNNDKKMLRRFKGEYILGTRISHPSLVQMFDLAETPEGVHFIVMEYLDGDSLAKEMAQAERADGQLGVQAALHIGWQISSVFAQLHERRIVHRDLKPGNIMRVKDPAIHGGSRYKLLDFGIAKLTDAMQAQTLNVDFQTSTGVHLGTLPLMSPESFHEKSTQGPEVDVYALGCMLYRCIAGNYPFQGANDMELVVAHMHDDPIPLTAEDPMIPVDVADIIHTMLAKKPADRPTMAAISGFFAHKLGLLSAVNGKVVIKGGTEELMAVIGDVSTGAATPTAGTAGAAGAPVSLATTDLQSVQSVQLGQQVTAPHTRLLRSRWRFLMGAASVAGIVLTGWFVTRTALHPSTQKEGQSQPAVSPAALVPTAPSAAATPDLGIATATPVSAADAAPPQPKAEEKPSQKRKKGKHAVGLFSDQKGQ